MKVKDLIPDSKNANKGTERGKKALDTSLRQYGAGRSILVDRDNRIIAGNKTAELAETLGIKDVVVVETDGTKLVAVKRIDLDLEDDGGKARALAIYDNRVGQLDLDWDIDMLKDVDVNVLIDLGMDNWSDEFIDTADVWKGMPEFEQEDKFDAFHSIKVHFETEEDLKAFAALVNQNVSNKTKFIWFPPKKGMNLKDLEYRDES